MAAKLRIEERDLEAGGLNQRRTAECPSNAPAYDLEMSGTSEGEPKREPPDVTTLLGVLHEAGVDYVVTGSTAAMLHGVELVPGDLDITPALDVDNLTRLAGVLESIDARQDPSAPFGHWVRGDDGEQHWVQPARAGSDRGTSELETRSCEGGFIRSPPAVKTWSTRRCPGGERYLRRPDRASGRPRHRGVSRLGGVDRGPSHDADHPTSGQGS